MTGGNFNFELQHRDRLLLGELAVMGIADRAQLLTASGFPSIRRINQRVRMLCKAGLIRQSQFSLAGRPALYVLTAKGFETAASRGETGTTPFKPLHGSLFIEHQLQINQIYLALKHGELPQGIQFRLWKSVLEPLSAASPIVPDGYVELIVRSQIVPLFLEVDRGTEGLKDWKAKTENYLRFALSGDFQEHFERPQFRVLVITQTKVRLEAIQKTISRYTDKIFRLSTFALINRDGLWSDVWFRPTETEALSLAESL
jgi:hypothetical protein